ncbi:MAG: hypothetical protein WDM80_02250 [Limisphaerales bacterium]
MKSKTKQGPLRFSLSLLHYGNSYYIERIAALEKALAKRPRQLQLDMLGEGEIAADWALLIRSILGQHSPKTQIITNARCSLKNGSVLVWLLGDRRLIRDDARLFFRRATTDDEDTEKTWKEGDLKHSESAPEIDPEEADHARVLQLINEFLPVKELVGRAIELPVLRQFGLVENEKLDNFLATAFAPAKALSETAVNESKLKRVRAKVKPAASVPIQK